MNILAIDQARNGAWSVFDYEKKKVVGYGTFSFDAKKFTYAKTIMYIKQIMHMVIRAYDVKFIAIEDIQLRANVQAFKRLAQLQGVLVNFCEENEYLYGFVAPTQWQNYCCARGRNSKEVESNVKKIESTGKKLSKILSIQFVKDQFGIETENDNLADSLSMAWYVVNNVEIENNSKRK